MAHTGQGVRRFEPMLGNEVTSQRFIAAQRPPANQIPDTDPTPASTHLEVSMTPAAAAAPGLWPYLAPVLLLFCSNIFMTLAWYGHLKFKAVRWSQ
jgi:hypothetical protein